MSSNDNFSVKYGDSDAPYSTELDPLTGKLTITLRDQKVGRRVATSAAYRPEGQHVKGEPQPKAIKDQGHGATLVDRVAQFIGRFVFLKEQSIYLLLALWVIGTYLYEDFDFYGYIFAYSPEPQSGKTRLLEVLGLLVHKPTELLVSPTPAILFRVGGQTQLLDDIDSWTNPDDLRGVLNAGFKKGGTVPRTEKTGDNGFEPKMFSAYCPRALDGIGTNMLSSATRDRTFMVNMERRKVDERGEKFKVRKVAPQAAPIKKDLETWASQNRQAIRDLYDKDEDFGYLESFSERTADVASPLAAILEVMFKGTGRLQEARSTFMQALGVTRGEVQQSDDVAILAGLLERMTSDPLVGNSKELAELIGMDEPYAARVSQALRRHGFKAKSIRVDGNDPLKRYELPKSKLKEIVERYGQIQVP